MRIKLMVVLAIGCLSGAPTLMQEENPYQSVADYSEAHQGHAVLIIQDGVVKLEAYQNGYNKNVPHILASGTKSFGCALAVVAQMDGLLTLDETVADTLTEWQTDAEKSQITVRQVLSQTDGLPNGEDILDVLTDDRAKMVLEIPLVAPVGERFVYGPSHFYVFGELLRRKLGGEDVVNYLERRILTPLGITNFKITRDGMGTPNLAAGGMLTARSWAKYGLLLLNNGLWGDEQILDEALLRDCFVGTVANPYYGLTFWLYYDVATAPTLEAMALQSPEPNQIPDGVILGETSPQVIFASGYLKQRLYLVPSKNLVMVRLGDGDDTYQDAEILQLLLAP